MTDQRLYEEVAKLLRRQQKIAAELDKIANEEPPPGTTRLDLMIELIKKESDRDL
jgi:hypothetical protein